MPPADGSSTRGGSTSVRGRVAVRTWLTCRQPACLKPRTATRLGQLCHGTEGWTDGRIAVSLNAPPPTEGGIITSVLALGRTGRDVRWLRQDMTKFTEILPPNTGSLQQNKN